MICETVSLPWVAGGTDPGVAPHGGTESRSEPVVGSLLVLLHAFNVDGASMMALVALQSPWFRSRFTRITVAGPQGGELEKEFRKIPGLVYEVVPWKEPGAPAGRLTRLLVEHDLVWVNTFDHPPEVFEQIERVGAKGLLFGHESMHIDSLFRASIDFGPRKLDAIRRLMAGGRLDVALPSASTCRYAAEYLMPEVRLLPYGIDTGFQADQPASFDDLDPVRFIVPSWLCDRKNQRCVPHVFRALLDPARGGLRRRNWTVTFAGTAFGAAHYRKFIDQTLRALPADRVTFLPMMPNDQMRELLARHHVLVFPSYNEALPVTVLEGMSSGRVIVSSDCEGCDEVVRPGETGYRFRRGDVAGLFAAVDEILDPARTTPSDLAALGRRASAEVAGMSVDAYARRLFDVLASARTYRVLEFADGRPTKTAYAHCSWPAVNQEHGAIMLHPPAPEGEEEPAKMVFADVHLTPDASFAAYVHLPRVEAAGPVRFVLELRQDGQLVDRFHKTVRHTSQPVRWEQVLGVPAGVYDLALFTEALETNGNCTAYFYKPQVRGVVPAGLALDPSGRVVTPPAAAGWWFTRPPAGERFDLADVPPGTTFEAVVEGLEGVTYVVEVTQDGGRVTSHRTAALACGQTAVRVAVPTGTIQIRLRAEVASRSARSDKSIRPTWWSPRLVAVPAA